jgi:hypothetical protein
MIPMRRLGSIAFCTAVTVAIVCPSTHAQGAGARPGVRVLAWDPLVPIRDRLLPEDETVEIDKDWLDRYDPGRLTARDVIEDATMRSDLVAVVEVGAVDTVLAEDDTWVNTRLAGTVRKIIRIPHGGSFAIGQRLDIQVSGGDIRIERVLVTTRHVKPVVPENCSYLLFLRVRGLHLSSLHHPLLIERGRLSYAYLRDVDYEGNNPLQGLSLSQVSTMVRRAKKSWLCGTECGG